MSQVIGRRSEEHTSELQSQSNLVCRLLLEKKLSSSDPLTAGRPGPIPRLTPVPSARASRTPFPSSPSTKAEMITLVSLDPREPQDVLTLTFFSSVPQMLVRRGVAPCKSTPVREIK